MAERNSECKKGDMKTRNSEYKKKGNMKTRNSEYKNKVLDYLNLFMGSYVIIIYCKP